jgi:hypothetical protein
MIPVPRRPPVESRKLLVASIGVASMTYVATTTLLPACGNTTAASTFPGGDSSSGDTGSRLDAIDDFPVGNFAAETGEPPFDARPGDSQAMDSPPSDAPPADGPRLESQPGDSQPADSEPSDVLQLDDFPVANLAVMPDAGMPDA